ncbi:MAG: hypothetical protein ACI8RO_000184 [Flavobacteriales bacterium]|jgi:hypothetical protein
MKKLLSLITMLAIGITIGYVTHFMSGQTPLIYGQKWHVHDINRPQPKIVTPAPVDNFGAPPSDAIVLFDGTNLNNFENKDLELNDGAMIMAMGNQQTIDSFGDVQLHIEWLSPTPSENSGQNKGNSGVIFMGLYEVQVLNSYQSKTYPDGQAGAVYGVRPPMVNAMRPADQWQNYDIFFRAPRFNMEGSVDTPAHVTVVHNGVLVQFNQIYNGPSEWRKNGVYKPHADKLPLKFQWHNSPVKYRNIWIRPLDEYSNLDTNSKR